MYASSRIEVGEPPRFAFLARCKAGRFAYQEDAKRDASLTWLQSGDASLTWKAKQGRFAYRTPALIL
jgi:hypothetical protein